MLAQVEAVDFYTAWLEELVRRIKDAQLRALETYAPAALVTFTNRSTQVVAATTMHSRDETFWKAEQAPHVSLSYAAWLLAVTPKK